MSSISVRPQMVDSLSADIANDAKGIGQELENLDAEVRTLIDQWDGAAQEAYHRAQNDYHQTAGDEPDSWPDFSGHR